MCPARPFAAGIVWRGKGDDGAVLLAYETVLSAAHTVGPDDFSRRTDRDGLPGDIERRYLLSLSLEDADGSP